MYDNRPEDHIANVQFLSKEDDGTNVSLLPGDTLEFTIFYGAANNKEAANKALAAVDAELASYGYSPGSIGCNADNNGSPGVDIMAFVGLGSTTPIFPAKPSQAPSDDPSELPSDQPSQAPSAFPSDEPSDSPSVSSVPSAFPSSSALPSCSPSMSPNPTMSSKPSDLPSMSATPSKTPKSTKAPKERGLRGRKSLKQSLKKGKSGGCGGNNSKKQSSNKKVNDLTVF